MTSPVHDRQKSGSEDEFGLKRVLLNLAHLLGGKAGAGLMSLVYLVIVARTLGVRDYGVLTLVNGYAQFVGSLVAFSGFHGLVRYGTIALEAGAQDRLARIARLMTVIECTFGLLAVLVAALLVPIVGPRLGWSDDVMRIALPYSLAVLCTVRATPQGLLQIARRFELIGLHQLIAPTIRLIGTLIVWGTGGGLHAFLVVWLLSNLAEGAGMWLLAWPIWRRLVGNERLRGPWRGILRGEAGFRHFILTTNVDLSLRELAPNLAPLTIGWMLGPVAAGLFSLAQRTTQLLQQPAILLSQASYAVLADAVARRRFDQLRRTVWRSALLAAAIATPIVLAFWLVGDKMLPLLGGRTFTGGMVIVTLLAGSRMAGLIASPVNAGLTALGRPQRSVAVTLVTNLLLYPALPLLIRLEGLKGAGWHALLQNVAAMTMLILFFRRDARDRPPSTAPATE
jgi:O-antigen/teichoic acid export membrane protein